MSVFDYIHRLLLGLLGLVGGVGSIPWFALNLLNGLSINAYRPSLTWLAYPLGLAVPAVWIVLFVLALRKRKGPHRWGWLAACWAAFAVVTLLLGSVALSLGSDPAGA